MAWPDLYQNPKFNVLGNDQLDNSHHARHDQISKYHQQELADAHSTRSIIHSFMHAFRFHFSSIVHLTLYGIYVVPFNLRSLNLMTKCIKAK